MCLNFERYIYMSKNILSANEKKQMKKLCKSLEGFRKKDWTIERSLEHLEKNKFKGPYPTFQPLTKRDEKHYLPVSSLLHIFVLGICHNLPLCSSWQWSPTATVQRSALAALIWYSNDCDLRIPLQGPRPGGSGNPSPALISCRYLSWAFEEERAPYKDTVRNLHHLWTDPRDWFRESSACRI